MALALAACASGAQVQDAATPVRDSPPSVPPGAFHAVVVRVVDGDTFVARRDGRPARVRLIGIDAPESVKRDAPVDCFGEEAAGGLRKLLRRGSTIRASFQGGDLALRRDRFGRDLWDVWLPDGRFLQATLVSAGLARARVYPPHTRYADVLAAAEESASAANAGLHSACSRSAVQRALVGR